MKLAAFCLLFLMFVGQALFAQQFNPPAYYNTGSRTNEPSAVVTADFNGDGKLDLAVADSTGNVVSVLLGNGDGTFQTAKTFAVISPYALAVADMNGDGIEDLLVQAAGGGDDLSIYLGNGDGTFRLKAKYPVNGYPIAVAAADLNGDGNTDVIVASSNGGLRSAGFVATYFGNGDGTVIAGGHYSAGPSPWAVAAADLNGDGHVDIVVGSDNSANFNNPNTLYVLLNKGNGTFSNDGTYQTGAESIGVTIADLNHDGKPDIVVSSAFNQAIAVLLGNGDGTFQNKVYYSTKDFGAAPQASVVADFNHDGYADIAVTLYDGGVVLFYGNGDGTFQRGQAASNDPSSGGEAIAMGDFNGDGYMDIATSVFVSTEVAVLLNVQ
jgi:hypothetical protein